MTDASVAAGVIDPDLPHDELARLVMALGTLVQRALAEPAPANQTVARLAERLLRPIPDAARQEAPVLTRVAVRSRLVADARSGLHEAIVCRHRP